MPRAATSVATRYPVAALLKTTKRFISLVLCSVAVNAGSLDSKRRQILREFVRSVLRTRKNQKSALAPIGSCGRADLAFDPGRPRTAASVRYRQLLVVDPTATRTGFIKIAVDQLGDRSFDGGGEEQRLSCRRSFSENAPDHWQETHVQHSIGFVKHDCVNFGQFHQTAIEKIDQTAWCGDQYPSAGSNRLKLILFIQIRRQRQQRESCVLDGKLDKCLWICMASSRVGLRITACTPEPSGCWRSFSKSGSTNARVLPVPV